MILSGARTNPTPRVIIAAASVQVAPRTNGDAIPARATIVPIVVVIHALTTFCVRVSRKFNFFWFYGE
jgi:hypothetical protein